MNDSGKRWSVYDRDGNLIYLTQERWRHIVTQHPMSPVPIYSYDKEADVLYISFAPGEKATAAVELNDQILLRFNRAEKRAVGLTLMDFSVLVQLGKLGPRHFPLTGLKQLEPAWQDDVIELITQSPVNQILRVALYMPSMTETVPITSVARPAIPLAV